MLESLKDRNFPKTMLKQLMVVALFFPVFTSDYGTLSAPDLIATNIFTTLFTVGILLQNRIAWKEKNSFGYGLLILLLVYNVFAFYANKMQLSWYLSQVNITAPFLMFIALVFLEKDGLNEGDELIRFFLEAIVVSNAIGLAVYFMGNTGVWLMNGKVGLMAVEEGFYERRYNWVFAHKSQYAFLLVLFLSLTVTYRRLFKNRWTFLGSIALLAVCLWASNTATSMVAAVFIFAGWFLDWLLEKNGGFKWKHLLWLAGLLVIAAGGFFLVIRGRRLMNLMTLNGRTLIWPQGLDIIRENPYGTGQMCGITTYPIDGFPAGTYMVDNLHNYFLNVMLQFSPKAGLAIIAMLVLTALTALKRNFSFTTLGILAALFIPMMMDWCVLLTEYPLLLLGLYFLFFCPRRKAASV